MTKIPESISGNLYAATPVVIKYATQTILGGISLGNDEKFIKRWEKSRQRGRMKYILTNCFIMEVAVVVVLSIKYFMYDILIFSWMNSGYFIGGIIGGVIGSILRWNKNEQEYADLINNK